MAATTLMAATTTLGTRAVLRQVEPGCMGRCTGCDKQIQFRARKRCQQVIANVYSGPRWDHVEHWHADCYVDGGEPHGPADTSKVGRVF